jgi:hypothetical protein
MYGGKLGMPGFVYLDSLCFDVFFEEIKDA